MSTTNECDGRFDHPLHTGEKRLKQIREEVLKFLLSISRFLVSTAKDPE